jgi:hypothetical protein
VAVPGPSAAAQAAPPPAKAASPPVGRKMLSGPRRFVSDLQAELLQRSLRWQVEEFRQGLRVDALAGGAVVQAVARGLGDRRSLMIDTMNMITPTTAYLAGIPTRAHTEHTRRGHGRDMHTRVWVGMTQGLREQPIINACTFGASPPAALHDAFIMRDRWLPAVNRRLAVPEIARVSHGRAAGLPRDTRW